MQWVFLFLLSLLLAVFIRDQVNSQKESSENVPIPISGFLVTAILYFLVSEGLINKEDEKKLEDKSLKELESHVLEHNLLSKQEWADLCLTECQLADCGDTDSDFPFV